MNRPSNAIKGFTLLESLVSIFLVSTLLVSLLAAFFISRLSTERAKHRIAAMNIIREYMEQEIRYGYLGGSVDGDYYGTVSSANPIQRTMDNIVYNLTPTPYPATTLAVSTSRYKAIGFAVEWSEPTFGAGAGPTCREQVATYVSEHN